MSLAIFTLTLAVLPVSAAEVRTFGGVTPAIFECIKTTSEAANGTIYEPRNADRGTATTTSAIWAVVLDYVFDLAAGEIAYTLVHKTWIVPLSPVWQGIEDYIAGCSN